MCNDRRIRCDWNHQNSHYYMFFGPLQILQLKYFKKKKHVKPQVSHTHTHTFSVSKGNESVGRNPAPDEIPWVFLSHAHPWSEVPKISAKKSPSLNIPDILSSSNFFQATLTSFVSIDNKFSGSTFSGSESELSLWRAEKWAQDAVNICKCSHEIWCSVNYASCMYLFDANLYYQLFLKMCRHQLDFCCGVS